MNGFCTNSSMYALIAFLIYFFSNVYFFFIFYCCLLLPHCLKSLAWCFLRSVRLRQRFIPLQSFLYLLLSSRLIFIKQRACWSTLFIEFVCWQRPAMPGAAVWPMYYVWKFIVRILCVLFHRGDLVQACCSFCDGAKTKFMFIIASCTNEQCFYASQKFTGSCCHCVCWDYPCVWMSLWSYRHAVQFY